MVSDAELVRRLRELVAKSDLTTTTAAALRRQLESDLGLDLSSRKAFIREQIDVFLQTHLEESKENAGEDENRDDHGQVEEESGESEVDSSEEMKKEGKNAGEDKNGEDSEQEEEESEVESIRAKKKGMKKNEEGKKRGGGFTMPCGLSPVLQKFVGATELARTEVVRKLWAYIRENNLQDPTNRKKILCDDGLKELFNVKSIDMFQMNKALAKHIWPLSSDHGSFSVHEERNENEKRPRKEKKEKSGKKDKQQKTGGSGFLAPLAISDALATFFGTGSNAVSRSDAVKRMWQYIKKNELQDPKDKRLIICDDELKKLFKVDSFHGFTVTKLLAPHFIKSDQ